MLSTKYPRMQELMRLTRMPAGCSWGTLGSAPRIPRSCIQEGHGDFAS
jgi:hypothetical protein